MNHLESVSCDPSSAQIISTFLGGMFAGALVCVALLLVAYKLTVKDVSASKMQ